MDDKKHGPGQIKCSSGDFYEGEWHHGKLHGQGSCKYASGNVYEGTWFEDKKHGVGKCVYANGDVYMGEWEKGHMHGEGTYMYASNGKQLRGRWEHGKCVANYEKQKNVPQQPASEFDEDESLTQN